MTGASDSITSLKNRAGGTAIHIYRQLAPCLAEGLAEGGACVKAR